MPANGRWDLTQAFKGFKRLTKQIITIN